MVSVKVLFELQNYNQLTKIQAKPQVFGCGHTDCNYSNVLIMSVFIKRTKALSCCNPAGSIINQNYGKNSTLNYLQRFKRVLCWPLTELLATWQIKKNWSINKDPSVMKLKKGIDNIDRSFHKSLKSASFRVKEAK